MADIDDDVLAYAMALGRHFMLRDPLPRKGKKAAGYRETYLEARLLAASGYIDVSKSIAYFMSRLIANRRVEVSKHSDKTRCWSIEDARTGMQIRFLAPDEKIVRAHALEASAMELDSSFEPVEPVEAATLRMRMVQVKRAQAIVAERAAARQWPPAVGSTEARVLALAQGGEEFETCRKIKGEREWTHYKPSTPSAFLAKLKDLTLRVHEVEEHAPDSQRCKGMGLAPGQMYVEVVFSKLNDVSSAPISAYAWVAKVEVGVESKKPSRAKSSSTK